MAYIYNQTHRTINTAFASSRLSQAHTLLELLIVLSIIALLTMMSTPSIQSSFYQIQAKSELDSLVSFLKSMREHALNQQKHITICHKSSSHCDHHSNSTLFALYENSQQDSNSVFASFFFESQHSHIDMNNLDAIRLNPLGMNKNIGSFYYCFRHTTYSISYKISLSMQGRFRAQQTTNTACLNSYSG